jgi:hypothetical protein
VKGFEPLRLDAGPLLCRRDLTSLLRDPARGEGHPPRSRRSGWKPCGSQANVWAKLVRSGEIEPEWSAYLVESLDDRLAADYDVETSFSKQDARGECRRSREFLNRIRRYLLKNGFEERELRKKQK